MKMTGNNNSGKLLGSVLTAGLLMFGTASYAQVTDDAGTTTQEPQTTQEQQRENVGNTEYDDDFDRFDATRDQDIDRTEFDRRMEERGTFEDWDTNRDRTIDEREFEEGVRTRQRTGATLGERTQDTQGTTGTAGDQQETTGATDYGTFDDWDRNRDRQLDEDEFREGTFDTWERTNEGTQGTNEGNQGTQGTGTGTDIDNGTGTDGGGK